MEYILKDGSKVDSQPVGKSSVKIGEVSPSGLLTVCDRGPAPKSGRGATVICKCKCGNYTLIKLNELRTGNTKSCGCYAHEIRKEKGKQVGNLPKQTKDYTQTYNPFYDFIKKLDRQDENNSYYWLVKCKKCGKEYEEIPSQLSSETRRRGNNPCDCWKKISKGELSIISLLVNNKIKFTQQQTFPTCLSPLGKLLKFDFFIENKYLIEFDGEQHFIPHAFGSGVLSGEEKLKLTQEYDKIKNKWCLENNIPLIRIPYTQYQNLNIKDLLLETSNFIIKGEENDN